jgi:hypothetical protein
VREAHRIRVATARKAHRVWLLRKAHRIRLLHRDRDRGLFDHVSLQTVLYRRFRWPTVPDGKNQLAQVHHQLPQPAVQPAAAASSCCCDADADVRYVFFADDNLTAFCARSKSTSRPAAASRSGSRFSTVEDKIEIAAKLCLCATAKLCLCAALCQKKIIFVTSVKSKPKFKSD